MNNSHDLDPWLEAFKQKVDAYFQRRGGRLPRQHNPETLKVHIVQAIDVICENADTNAHAVEWIRAAVAEILATGSAWKQDDNGCDIFDVPEWNENAADR